MKLSFGKKKIQLSDYQKIMDEFKSDINVDTTKKYNDINKIYTEIKEYYIDKVRIEKFDIKIEKIRIEQNLGSFFDSFTSYSIAFYIAVFGSIFYFMIQSILSYVVITDTSNNATLSIIILSVILGIFIFQFSKSIQKEKPRNFMLNISLKVLEDIENGEPKQIKGNQRADNTATITAKQKIQEYIRKPYYKKM